MAWPHGGGRGIAKVPLALLGPVVEHREGAGDHPPPMVTPLSLSPPVDNIGEKSGNTRGLHWPGLRLRADHGGSDQRRSALLPPEHGRVVAVGTGEGVVPALEHVPEGSLDAVVTTFVLCRVDDPGAALALIRRAMTSEGVLLFTEHTGATGWRRRLQQAATPVWQRLAPGCHLDRDVPAAIRAAGLAITDIHRFPLPWARALLVKGVQGTARPRPVTAP
ncbi:MAG: class I SAM-dependent methyltransferase [Actinomycetota bacterium]|nr:class I SAM-dependent methyltransferase [Actinomycetota bacterium]MDQ3680743.1 class I SAM-dependent methyltransferase [Actinomycetota bacterium]